MSEGAEGFEVALHVRIETVFIHPTMRGERTVTLIYA